MAKAKAGGGAKNNGPAPAIVIPPAAPAGSAPAAPAGFQKLDGTQVRRMVKPFGAQASSAGAVGAEILASPTYVKDFGSNAMAPAALAAAFTSAGVWETEEGRAALWSAYVKNASEIVWSALLVAIENDFHKDYLASLFHDPTIATRYPLLAQFLGARSEVALRGAETRKAKKAAAKKAVPAAPVKAGG